MKNLIPLFILFFTAHYSTAQTYQYIPMDLDTSSFWVHDFSYYSGFNGFPEYTKAEIVSYVDKDTIINSKKYFKIIGYISELRTYEIPGSLSKNPYVSYFREDTVQKKLFVWDASLNRDSTYLDFGMIHGDTIEMKPYNSYIDSPNHYIVDSIRFVNYFGQTRRSIYFDHFGSYPNNPIPNRLIEGIGMRFSFPFRIGGGEWGYPGFTCLCYKKNDTLRYLENFSADSCYKKKPFKFWPVRTSDISNSLVRLIYAQNEARIYNPKEEELVLTLTNLQGQKVWTETNKSSYMEKNMSAYPSGIYILSVQSSKGIENRKILIR